MPNDSYVDPTVTGATAPGYRAFESRDDLADYGNSALLLFVAQLRLGIDDIDTFAANSLTDGGNDKKCDLVAFSPDRERIILAQGHMSSMDAARPRRTRRVI